MEQSGGASCLAVKVCDVTQLYSPISGGVKRYLEDKMAFLASAGVEHVLIVPGEEERATLRHATRIYEVPSPKLPGSASYRALLRRALLLSILESERPDVIEAGDPYRGAWIALEAAGALGIPVVGFYHSDLPRGLHRRLEEHARTARLAERALERYVAGLYNRMAATVVASRAVEARLREMGIGRVVRIPLGTDTDRFQPSPRAAAVRRELGLASGDRLLLFVGRLAPEKNPEALLGLIAALAPWDGAGRFHLLAVGDGEARPLLAEAAARRRDVTWWPYCDSTERLCDVYSAADLMVHPGTTETFGLTALEAQACGTPVLAVRGGGLDEAVAPEERFRWPESPEPGDLAAAAARILTEEGPWGDGRSQRRERRRRTIIETLSIDRTFARLLDLYGRLTESAAHRRMVEH